MKSDILAGMSLTRNLSLAKPRARLDLSQERHHTIFDTIEQRDGNAVRQVMHSRVDNAWRRVFEATPDADRTRMFPNPGEHTGDEINGS